MGNNMHRSEKGQALVEFALIIVILLTFLFVIIEAGRIFQAWQTVQNSARSAARYALTGQYDDTGIFNNPACPLGTPPSLWQVCSVQDEALRTAAGLNIDPAAGPTDPRAFGTQVLYVVKGSDPITYTEGVAPPGEPTRVRVYYNVEIITPFLRVIADNIRVAGQVEVVTEDYDQITPGDIGGSTVTDNPPSPPLPVEVDIVVNKRGPNDLVYVDETITYYIDVLNTGIESVPNVTVIDMLPPETIAVTGWTVTSDGNPIDLATCFVDSPVWEIDCVIPSLTAGQLATVNVDLVLSPQIFNEETSPASVNVTNTVKVFNQTKTIDPDLTNNESYTTTQVLPWADLKLQKNKAFGQQDPVSLGEEVVFIITVRNEGPNTGKGAFVSDDIPAGLKLINADSSDNSCIVTGSNINCSLDPVGPNDTPVITVTTMATSAGSITNTATVSNSDWEIEVNDPDQTDNSLIQVLETNLIVKKSGPTEVLSGEAVTYTVAVTNAGPGLATSVTITDSMSYGVEVKLDENWSISPECQPIGSPPLFSCLLTDTLTMEDPPILFTFVVTPTLITGVIESIINNNVVVSSNEGLVTNTHNHDVRVYRDFNLIVEKNAPGTVFVGDKIPYIITVTNNGPSTAYDFVIEDSFDANIISGTLTFTEPACQGVLNTRSDGFSCTVPELIPSDSYVLNFEATGPSEGSVDNTVTVTSSNGVPYFHNVATIVEPVADLVLSEVLPRQKVTGTITYTFNITNNGPSAAAKISVTNIITGDFKAVTITTSSDVCDTGVITGTTVITCFVTNSLPVSSTESFIIAFSYVTDTQIFANVIVSSETFDPDMDNNGKLISEPVFYANHNLFIVDLPSHSNSIAFNLRSKNPIFS